VSAGGTHTCGIRTSRRLYCWGSDSRGQLGDGGTNTDRSVPTEVYGGQTDWASVSAGGGHTCARRTNGRLYCWGSDFNGALGDGLLLIDRTTPSQVSGHTTNWASVDAGEAHTCARRTSGRLYCWGSNSSGQLGDGTRTNRSVPIQVIQRTGFATDWIGVSAGGFHTCARKTNGRLYCWGFNGAGQLGDGTTDTRGYADEVSGGQTDWAGVTAGRNHTCARKTNGRLYCWGFNFNGQLGDETRTSRSVPTEVYGGQTNWADPSASDFTCATKTNRTLWCWGDSSPVRPHPIQVGAATNWTRVSAGGLHTCARKTNRTLWCWGNDQYGQLGDGGTNTDRSIPTQVL
jgi:alpha-tubulin suppressor-like RCC1 family protein